MMTWSVVLGVSFWVMGLMPSEVGPAYPNSGFLPAVHGSTPDCVRDPRDTFCVDPKKYPKERIVYLLENKMFDIDSLLMDETRDSYTFEARDSATQSPMMYDYEPPRQPYDPPSPNYGPPRQTYGPRRPASGYLPPPPPPPLPPAPPAAPLPIPSPPPPRRRNQTTTFKPYGPPSSKYGPPPTPPAHRYSQPTHLYSPPTAAHDSEGPYPRYPKAPPPHSGTYIPRYRPQPKDQSWWRKIMRSSRRRQRRQASSTDLCPYESEYIMPRAALNNKGDWMYLVNLSEVSAEYTQLVESKKCIRNTCSGACDIPDGSSAVCQQQYVQKRLIALDGSGTKLATDTFWFPSCCVCMLRQGG